MLGAWGNCPCEPVGGGESMMMGGGESLMSGEGLSGSYANPYDGTYVGLLLDELIVTSDAELAAVVAALLQELLEQ